MNQAASIRARGGAAFVAALQKLPARIEAVLAMAVVGAVFLLVLPIPAAVLDVLIAINLFLSSLLVMLSLYVTGLTAFSTFPVILLLSTLYRLGISVATTRLILLEGHAGAIVDTFGNFVVGGSVLVGLVVFLIVTVVQFIVVTKGAERVAEVSARFSLDGMPAKQLAIENELRSGLVDQAEAKRQRQLLSTETQLLGAMDGAMKFVKGDAIAGMVIVVVNLLGGLASGLLVQDMTAAQAIAHYSVQTVGDGLVTQIPALLTCLTAAILVTRVDDAGTTRGKESKVRSFGNDLIGQLGAYPRALWGLASTMLVFALIPGMPALVFAVLAILAALLAYAAQQKATKRTVANAKSTAKSDMADAAIVHEFTQMEPLQLVFPGGTENDPAVADLRSQVNEARNELVRGMGMSLPVFTFPHDPKLPAGLVEMRVYEVPVGRMPWRPDHLAFVGRDADEAATIPGSDRETGAGPMGTDIVWLPRNAPITNDRLRYAAMSWVACLRDRVKRKIVRYGPRFTGVQQAQKYMTWMEGWMPELAKELQKNLSNSKLADVTQRLLREGVSIRNMRLIIETLADVGQRERDPALLTEFVRHALREQLCHELAPTGRLDVFVLEPEIEDQLTQSIRHGSAGSFLALEPEVSARIVEAVRRVLTRHIEPGHVPVMVCAQDIRRFVRTMLEPDLPDIVVLSLSELSPEVSVSVRASVELPSELP